MLMLIYDDTLCTQEIEDEMGQLKAKLAKLKRELLTPSSSGGGGPGIGFDVARSGIASVGFVGLHGAPIQILDLPGIIEGAKDGRGRVARSCDLIFIVLDVLKPLGDKALIENELEGFGIRLNKSPPHILIKKKDKGGITISNTVPLTKLEPEEIRAVLAEYKLSNCDVAFRCDASLDELIDVIEGNRIYMPCIYVLNKIDAISIEELDLLYRIPNSVPISAKMWLNIDELIDVMWEKLDMVRVYTRPRGRAPDYSSPVVLPRSKCSVEDFCNAIHRDIFKQMRTSIVWGTSAKHSRGQKVGGAHILEDEDVVQIIKKN
ncbi:GTP-binding protein rbg1 [Cystobasidiomycetes sp. EMM_F5]